MDLSDLKSQSELSNKAWDKATKGLRKNNVISISKVDDNLIVEIGEESILENVLSL